jgi:hypothetical protein
MIKLQRDQAISIAALALLLLACVFTVNSFLQARADALRETEERRQLVDRLEAGLRSRAEARARSRGSAPAAAFVNASTHGLAVAELQAYLSRLVAAQHATLLSSDLEPARRDDASDALRLKATLDTSLRPLQALLYQLETGTPYVFVDALKVELSASVQRAEQDPALRVILGVRAIWQREAT